MPASRAILLVDNGSLSAAATLSLRQLAADLAVRVGCAIEPVSLLHSSAIAATLLEGRPAEILEPAIRRRHQAGVREFLVVPLFFGPSAALTEYIPERVRVLSAQLAGLTVRVASPVGVLREGAVVEPRLVSILEDHVRQAALAHALVRPWVILVDHGSPQPAVGAVRDALARGLEQRLSGFARAVLAASMERREGAPYDFNEPLLARALEQVDGPGIVALLFFSAGRHAGPGGDIAEICAEAQRHRPGLRVALTRLVGEHPLLVDILADRLRALL